METQEIKIMRNYLLGNASGVRLWVALCLGEIIRLAKKGFYTWTSLKNLLTALPLELQDIYQHTATELNNSHTQTDRAIASRLLGWVMAASPKGPFRLRELLDALSIPDRLNESTVSTLSKDPLVTN
jgi:hypothetical protein